MRRWNGNWPMADAPSAGEVFRYPYLWRREADAGETEGRKKRPACMAVVVSQGNGRTLLFVVAITTLKPDPGRIVLEVPEIEKRRAGLSRSEPSWVILDEVNVDVLERSYAFEDRTPLGRFSASFTRKIQQELRKARSMASLRAVQRR